MAVDFKELSKKIGGWIFDNLDHRLILSQRDPIAKLLTEAGENVYMIETPPSAENLAQLIYYKTKDLNLPVTKIAFWESPTSVATYKE